VPASLSFDVEAILCLVGVEAERVLPLRADEGDAGVLVDRHRAKRMRLACAGARQ
jgi:hypothetical protein